MAVTAMKSVSIVGPMSKLDKAAEICGKSEVFHPDDVSTFYSDSEEFLIIAQKNNFASLLDKLKNALYSADFKMEIVNTAGFTPDAESAAEYVDRISGELYDMLNQKQELSKKIEECTLNMEQTKHFVGLGLELDKVLSCEFVKANFGRLPKESYEKLKEYENNPYVVFFPCTSDDSHYWGVYIAPIEQHLEIDRIFAGLYFEKSNINGLSGTPEQFFAEQEKKLPELKNALSELNKKLSQYKNDNRAEILRCYSYLEEQNLWFSIKSRARRYNNNFILTGWIPSENEKSLKDALSELDGVNIDSNDGKNELKRSPPVKLKNNFFSKPFEYYTEMYGLPAYNEIDPTGFVAITYTLLFGIMFADVGHGIALFIISLFMCKRKMALGPLLIPCSVASTLFGFIFGSVFGFEHLLDPLYHAIGFSEKPIEVMSPSVTNTLIYAAVGLGILLLIIAMLLSIYSNIRRKNYGEAVFGVNGIAGLVFYTSVAAGIVFQMLLGFEIMSLPYIIFLIVIPIILVFLREPLGKKIEGKKDWKPESIGSFIIDNLFEMIEVCLSYVTNTMSFLRVGAFVLVHAGMMQVVFVLAEMVGGAGYSIILVIGNIIVIALEALLVGIQVLRLEFYEMFNRFYTGDGRAFKPAKLY